MKQCTVQFLPHQRHVIVPQGETIIRAALEAGVHINASCGGEGVCGKCRVLVEEGFVEDGLSEMVSRKDREKDKVVFIGNSSLLGAQFCTIANHLRAEVIELTNSITNFELSETPSYMDHYMAALFLPHTNMVCKHSFLRDDLEFL